MNSGIDSFETLFRFHQAYKMILKRILEEIKQLFLPSCFYSPMYLFIQGTINFVFFKTQRFIFNLKLSTNKELISIKL